MRPLLGGSVSQIGILVRDLEEGLARHSAWAGEGPWRIFTYGPETVPRSWYRGAPGEFVVRIAIGPQTPQVELLELVTGPSVYDGYREGLHHLGFWVDSLDEAIAAMAAEGYETVMGGAGYGLDGDGGFAYFDTARDLGIILEAIEVPRRRREPDAVWP